MVVATVEKNFVLTQNGKKTSYYMTRYYMIWVCLYPGEPKNVHTKSGTGIFTAALFMITKKGANYSNVHQLLNG